MAPPKRVLCMMDLSSLGRASLGVAGQVLAACGQQACLLPTALFSSHTGGFGPVEKQDEAAFATAALAHYARQGITFHAVYIGYLYGPAQFAAANAALSQYPNALHVVDPALGDDGKPYTGLDDDTARAMRQLCARAGLVCPNYTESAMLCGDAPDAGQAAPALVERRLARLGENGASVLITSVPGPAGTYETWGLSQPEGEIFRLPSRRVPQRYPGTGDLFCAAVVGRLLHGDTLQAAAQTAAYFVEQAVQATYTASAEARHGVWFEPFLPLLQP
ncbi:bifunctional hydroxymethylpyrimidine kinase/phosphomethylpyrimidine kinase [Ruminococcaceae bacterium OttesenSCG-928-O06]|nr:bifunctional hydroxymethylpyrimidine kinase/phosphomethylpyrimidine kinase [Ruminococcaceae bacterium OttesenSCG-928-O06]